MPSPFTSRLLPARALLAATVTLLAVTATAQPPPLSVSPVSPSPSPTAANAAPDLAELERRAASAPASEQSARLLAFAAALEATDLTRALTVARQAHATATRARDELLADARVVNLLRLRGDYTEALTTARASLARATALGEDFARARLIQAHARIAWNLGDFPTAIAANQELIALAEKLGDRLLVGRGHLGLSVIYGEMKEGLKARAAEEVALGIAEQIGDLELQADALNNLGNNYRTAGELARAREFHTRALTLRTTLGQPRALGDSHINLSEVARTAGDLPTALAHAERALALYESLGAKRYIANAHLQLATILRLSGRIDDALARIKLGFPLAESLASPAFLAHFHREFVALHEARADWPAAFTAQRALALATDAALGEKTRQQLTTLTARYEADRRAQEIALLRGDHARQAAELQAKDADLRAAESALERAEAIRLALGLSLVSLAVALGAIIMLQRYRLRAERRILDEARRARDVAEEADRIKTRFLGVASHDIRAPLGNIVSLADTLRESPADPATHQEHIDLISSEAQRVLSLVEDLLTTAALESGKLELRPAPTDLTEISSAVVDSLRWQASAKRQTLTLLPAAPAAGRLTADAARLYQVVANLVTNAIKFSPAGATVTVGFARTPTTVSVIVRDEGPGLSAADIAKLFQPFDRLGPVATAGESSHGLGLSIAHEIVRLHGGTLRVDSRPGFGATFTAELPLPT